MANCDDTFDIRFECPYCHHDPLETQRVEDNLRAKIAILREALHNLFEACMLADCEGELSNEITVTLMDAASNGLDETK